MNNPNDMENKFDNQHDLNNDDSIQVDMEKPILSPEFDAVPNSSDIEETAEANEWKAPDNIVNPDNNGDVEQPTALDLDNSIGQGTDTAQPIQAQYSQPQSQAPYNNAPPTATPNQQSSYSPYYPGASGYYRGNPTNSYNAQGGYNTQTTQTQPNPMSNTQGGYNTQTTQTQSNPMSNTQGGYAQAQTKVAAPKKKKEHRKFSFGSVVAISLCFAIICSTITGGLSFFATQKSIDNKLASLPDGSISSNSAVENINITGDTESLIPAVAKKAAPSVVGIRVTTKSNYYSFFGMGGDSQSEGSGVVYTADGYIITNYHVISAAVEGNSNSGYGYGFGFGYGNDSQSTIISVFLPSDPETEIDAQLIGYDVSADVALLKIEKMGLPAIEIADSDRISVGDTTVAIGNPGGLDFMGSVSTGIVSGLNRTLSTENGIEMNLIQTDAAINPGNSGGALVNSKGQLIGINNSKISGDGFEGMGFAIPSNTVVEIIERLINQENQPASYLGVTIDTSYTASALQSMGYPAGVVVFSVAEGSPAYQAGIKEYDIITAINGTSITTYAQLNSEKNKYSPGDKIAVTIYRNGQTADAQVTLGTTQTVAE